ncbi:MAG: 5'-nucleotidase C-terminal domain-containing protein, partial [Leucobacter sp.]
MTTHRRPTVRRALSGAAVLALMLAAPVAANAAEEDRTDLTFVVTQDFHGRIDANTVRWAGTIEELRANAEHSIFLSAGDNFGNSLYASSVQGEKPTVDVLNALDLQASAAGNGEYFIGHDNFMDLAENVAEFPYLAANVVDAATGEPLLAPYTIREVDGVRIGIIGVVTPDTQVQFPSGDPEFLSLIPALNAAAEEIETLGLADVTVALVHEGGGLNSPPASLEDELATGGVLSQIIQQSSPLIDALFTAHTHNQYVYNAPVPGDEDRTRPVIQAGAFGQLLGEVTLTYDRAEDRVVASTARIAPLTQTPEAALITAYPRVAEVKTIVDAALAYAEREGSRPAGQVSAPITTAFSGGDYVDGRYAGGTTGNRTLESSLGTLVANMFRDVQQDQAAPPQFGLTIPNFIRSDLMPDVDGNVPVMKIIETFSIRDSIVAADITGAQLKRLLEQQWQRTPAGEAKGYIQMAMSDNLTYTYDDARPEGDRITSITLDGRAVQAGTTYRVGLSGAILIGIVNFHEGVELTNKQDSGLLDVEGFQRYFAELSEKGPVEPSFAKHGAKLVETAGSAPLGGSSAAGTAAAVEPGGVIEFDVSALDLTSLGAPANTELTVALNGEQVSTAPVTGGTARVRFTVPEELAGQNATMRLVASPSGTVVQRDFAVAGEAPGGDADGGDTDADGGADGADGAADGTGGAGGSGSDGSGSDGAAGSGSGASASGTAAGTPTDLSRTGSDAMPWTLIGGGAALVATALLLLARARR